MTDVHWLDLTLIVVYLVGLVAFGLYISRGVKTGTDYFLENLMTRDEIQDMAKVYLITYF